MTLMKITWEFNREKQADYYLETLNHLKKGFYNQHKFYLLDYLPEKFRNRVVYLPYRNCAAKLIRNHHHTCSLNKLNSHELTCRQKNTFNKKEVELRERIQTLTNSMCKYLPNSREQNILISPSFYGGIGTYNVGNTIVLKPRYDRTPDEIIALLTTALVHKKLCNDDIDDNRILWKEKQKQSEKIQSELGLKIQPILKILNSSMSAKYIKDSKEYYDQLGISIDDFFDENNINFTSSEMTVVKLLRENNGMPVKFDEIALKLWGDNTDEKYSLYAISKMVERIRGKLKKADYPNLIHTQRGVGYAYF